MRDVEKRRGDRLLCAGLVEVRWAESSAGLCKAFANLDDLSPKGVSLMLDRPVKQGTFVEFLHSGQMVRGDVRHCTQTDIGWIAGVHFGPDSQWDPGIFPPEHLLDPDRVSENIQSRAEPPLAPEIKNTISCLVLSQAVREGDK
jgi:hypothetical protein